MHSGAIDSASVQCARRRPPQLLGREPCHVSLIDSPSFPWPSGHFWRDQASPMSGGPTQSAMSGLCGMAATVPSHFSWRGIASQYFGVYRFSWYEKLIGPLLKQRAHELSVTMELHSSSFPAPDDMARRVKTC